MKARIVADIVKNGVDRMFQLVGLEYKLKTGDFAPEQDNQLDKIKDDLYFLLVAFVNQNKKGVKNVSAK